MRHIIESLYWRVLARAEAEGLTPWRPLVPEPAFTRAAEAAIATLKANGHRFGDYLEFGVSRGTSFACMGRALSAAGLAQVRLIGFDSFEGLPAEAANEGWRPNEFRSTEAATRRYLARRGVPSDRVRLVKGWFDATLTEETRRGLELSKVSLAMLDCDIYSATKTALLFLAPLIRDEAVLFFDDWGWRERDGTIGQKEAFEELLASDPALSASPLASYSEHARVFCVRRGT